MSFILVPRFGEDIQINAWNWRPTLELLRSANVIGEEDFERLGAHGCGGQADADLASRMAEVVERKLVEMQPGERIVYDLTVTAKPKKKVVFSPDSKPDQIDTMDLYSASYDWLVRFRDFCKSSGGFEVL
jgi:hypothetical protein